MSVATVYNNLKVFIEAGLVRELTYGNSSSRFDADVTDHYHAKCTQCGAIVDFNYPPLKDVEACAAKETRFQISGHRLEVYGICASCSPIIQH
jgi:Fur family peroxide stress response transcriptional regulator